MSKMPSIQPGIVKSVPRCEACHETKDLHMIGGALLCLHHVDLPFCRDVNPGEKLPDPDGIDE